MQEENRTTNKMGVDLVTHRCRIGMFSSRLRVPNSNINVALNLTEGLRIVGTVLFIGLLLLMSGIEPNPGPKVESTEEKVEERNRNESELACKMLKPEIKSPSEHQTDLNTSAEDEKSTSEVKQILEESNHNTSVTSSTLIDKLNTYGLDGTYWSKVLKKEFKMTNARQTDYLNIKHYPLLKKHRRVEWENNALKDFLTAGKKEKSEKSKPLATEASEQLQEIELSRKQRISTAFNELSCGKNDTTDDKWAKNDERKRFDIASVESNFKLESSNVSVQRKNELSPVDLVENASAGLVLRGIFLTKDKDECFKLKKFVIRAPDNIRVRSPFLKQTTKTIEIASSRGFDVFQRSMEHFGYETSLNLCVKPFCSISASKAKKSNQKNEKEHNFQKYFHSKTVVSIVPLCSVELKSEAFQLLPEVIESLKNIEQLYMCHGYSSLVEETCRRFFKTYGTHINTGTIHFGGIFERSVKYESNCSSEKEKVEAMVGDILDAVTSITVPIKTIPVGGSISANRIKSETSFSRSYNDSELQKTYLDVKAIGGIPGVTLLSDWKSSLIDNRSTWAVIDRGDPYSDEFVGLWKLVRTHASCFYDAQNLSEIMKKSWVNITGLQMDIRNEDEGADLIQSIKDTEKLFKQIKKWYSDENILQFCGKRTDQIAKELRKIVEQATTSNFLISLLQKDKSLDGYLLKLTDLKGIMPDELILELQRHINSIIDIIGNKNLIHQNVIDYWYKPGKKPAAKFSKFLSGCSFTETKQLILNLRDKVLPFIHETENINRHLTAEINVSVRQLFAHFKANDMVEEKMLLSTVLLQLPYNQTNSSFEQVCTIDELHKCIQEAEKILNYYKTYSNSGKQILQAFLVHHTVAFILQKPGCRENETLLKEWAGTKSDHLTSPIKDLLIRYTNEYPYQLTLLLKELEEIIAGKKPAHTCPVSLENINTLLSLEKDSEFKLRQTMQKQSQPKVNVELFSVLGLEQYFPMKITIQDAIQISVKMKISDLQLTDVPWIILKELLAIDYRSRDKPISDVYKSRKDLLVASNKCVLSLKEFLNKSNAKVASLDSAISPLDASLAIFCCCDSELQQILVHKMFICRLAIPLIYPNMSSNECRLSLWPLRAITLQWKSADNRSNEARAVKHRCKLVSFIRLKRPLFSKSKLLNTVISDLYHDTFYSQDCPLGTTDKVIANGLIECSWYLPSGEDSEISNEVILFLNLRGDALTYESQANMLSEICEVIVVLVELDCLCFSDVTNLMSKMHGKGKFIVLVPINSLHIENAAVMEKIVLYTEKCNVDQEKVWIVTTMFNEGNADEIKQSVRTSLAQICRSMKGKTLLEVDTLLCGNGLNDIENDTVFLEEKLAADKVIEFLKEIKCDDTRDKFIPLQKNHWKQITHLTKKQHREGMKLPVHEQNALYKELSEQRHLQLKLCENLSPGIGIFISRLTRNIEDKKGLAFFLQWLKFNFEDYLTPGDTDIHHESKEDFQFRTEDTRTNNQTEGKAQIYSYSLEHLIREIGQIYEAISYNKGRIEIKNSNFVNVLPRIAAKLLLYGHQFELMDGDVSNVPLAWVKAVFNSLLSLIGNKKIFTLSVLGIESSGKSTLLNTMFGLQFSVSAGKCTKGVFMQLVPVHKKARFAFDYILVVDTQGLRSEQSKVNLKTDNELATLVIGLADVILINIKGEKIGDVKDVLQIAVLALLRLKSVNKRLNLRQSCVFIHQNVPAVDAKEKLQKSRKELSDTLDAMTIEAAEQEQIEDIKSFGQVIEFDVEQNVWYFPDLWEGSPPMAPANTQYSRTVEDVKNFILENIAVKKAFSRTITDTVIHLEDLWKGIMTEDFVLSFRNSLEIKAYNVLENKYQELIHVLENTVFHIITSDVAAEFCKCKTSTELDITMSDVISKVIPQIEIKINETKDELSIFCETHTLCNIILKWRASKLITLLRFSEEVKAQVRTKIIHWKEQRRFELLNRNRQVQYEMEINQKAKELAEEMKGESASDEELAGKFQDMWAQWLFDILPTIQADEKPISEKIESKLYQRFYQNQTALRNELETHPLEQKLKSRTLEGYLTAEDIDEGHLSIRQKSFLYLFSYQETSLEKCRQEALRITNKIFRKIETFLSDISSQDIEFRITHVDDLLSIILTDFDEHNENRSVGLKFSFLSQYKVKVAVLTLRYALLTFTLMTEQFKKKHDVKEKLKAYRETSWLHFRNMVTKETEEVIAATFFGNTVKTFLIQNIQDDMPMRIQSEILSNFTTKTNLIIAIMDDLADNQNFVNYTSYITDPYTFAFRWITEYINKKMFSSSDAGSRYSSIANDAVSLHINHMKESIKTATNYCSLPSNKTTDDWINLFESDIQNKLPFPSDLFPHVRDRIVTDFINFQRLLLDKINAIKSEISEYFKGVTSQNIIWNYKTPYLYVMERLWGCDKDCPFCHEPCQRTDPSHIDSLHHSCIQHRPLGVTGVQSDKGDLSTDTCNVLVQTKDLTFNCASCDYQCRKSGVCKAKGEENKYHDCRKYKNVIPEWEINPSSTLDCAEYWMWFMSTFRDRLAASYGINPPDIPDSWKAIDIIQAKNSLRETKK